MIPLPIRLHTNSWLYYQTEPLTELREVYTGHLRFVLHAKRGRLLGLVPFWTCICPYCRGLSLSQTCYDIQDIVQRTSHDNNITLYYQRKTDQCTCFCEKKLVRLPSSYIPPLYLFNTKSRSLTVSEQHAGKRGSLIRFPVEAYTLILNLTLTSRCAQLSEAHINENKHVNHTE